MQEVSRERGEGGREIGRHCAAIGRSGTGNKSRYYGPRARLPAQKFVRRFNGGISRQLENPLSNLRCISAGSIDPSHRKREYLFKGPIPSYPPSVSRYSPLGIWNFFYNWCASLVGFGNEDENIFREEDQLIWKLWRSRYGSVAS